jgi:hypothetical protein
MHPTAVAWVFRVFIQCFFLFEIQANVGAFIELAILANRTDFAANAARPAVLFTQLHVITGTCIHIHIGDDRILPRGESM